MVIAWFACETLDRSAQQHQDGPSGAAVPSPPGAPFLRPSGRYRAPDRRAAGPAARQNGVLRALQGVSRV